MVNIIKHTKASEVSIDLHLSNEVLLITVQDNGHSISQNQIFGFGLMSIRERINLLRGSFEIQPVEKGTLAVIKLPIDCGSKNEKKYQDCNS